MRLANSLKAFRTARGVSARAQAREIGMPFSVYQRFEAGRRISQFHFASVIRWILEEQ